MAVLRMQRIYIYALIKYCKDIMEMLQRRGVIEIENIDLEDSVFYKDDTASIRAQYSGVVASSREAQEILARYAPRKKGLLSSFAGREQLSRSDYDKLANEAPDILRVAYDISAYQKNIDMNEAEKVKYQTQLDIIQPWLDLDVPMTFSGTSTTRAFIGSFAGIKTSTDITAQLAEIIPDVESVDIEIVHNDENQTCVFVLAAASDADAVSDALRRIGFEYPSYQSPVVPRQRETVVGLEQQALQRGDGAFRRHRPRRQIHRVL